MAEVLAPERLKELVASEAEKVAAKYALAGRVGTPAETAKSLLT